MKKIKEYMVDLYRFLNSQRTSKYVVNIIFCFVFLLVFNIYNHGVINDVISVFLGFLVSNLVVGLVQVLFRSFEDRAKVTDDTQELIEIYRKEDIKKTVPLNGTSATVAYKEVYCFDGEPLDVIDDEEKFFEPDGFISDNYLTLYSAHRMSIKKNFNTVRLDDFVVENGRAKFFLSRSNYYYHLVTNRAMDYRIDDDLSLRTYYDYGPYMNTPKESNMSNHIGINALVFLKDGELLLPRRNGNSTISKNLITSSIAIMLKLPQDSNKVTKEYLFRDCILEALVSRTKMRKEWIVKEDVDIKFLGFGQNPYEGGKPQFYYSVQMKKLGRRDYITKLCEDKMGTEKTIDVDKYMYVANTKELKFDKNENLVIPYYHGTLKNEKYMEKERKSVVGYEKSFLANLWHAQTAKEKCGLKLQAY